MAEDGGDLAVELRPAEATDLDPEDARQAFHLGQPWSQRMPPIQFVRAVCADDREPFALGVAGQE